MSGRTATVLAAAFCTVLLGRSASGAADAAPPSTAKPAAAPASTAVNDPMEFTRQVLARSNVIVRGPGDRKDKLRELSDLLRGFLDTNALARLAAQWGLMDPTRAL